MFVYLFVWFIVMCGYGSLVYYYVSFPPPTRRREFGLLSLVYFFLLCYYVGLVFLRYHRDHDNLIQEIVCARLHVLSTG